MIDTLQVGWTVRVISGPLEGTYGVVEQGVRWRHVLVTIDDETKRWLPLAMLEVVGDGK